MKKWIEKKLGSWYLLVLNYKDNDNYNIELYKKWDIGGSYEWTEYQMKLTRREDESRYFFRERVVLNFNKINLKNMYDYLKRED